jgi:RimJ/RimL family protein N-acetyltransferase
VLDTDLLHMTPLSLVHLADMVALYQDPEVTRFLAPLDEAGHRARLRESERSWRERGYGRAALYERSTGHFVGRGGLTYWPQFDEVELGWALHSDARGRGYATDSARAWMDWAFANTSLAYVTANIDPANTASLGVAGRLGMAPLREDTFGGRSVVVFAAWRPLTVEAGGR